MLCTYRGILHWMDGYNLSLTFIRENVFKHQAIFILAFCIIFLYGEFNILKMFFKYSKRFRSYRPMLLVHFCVRV